MNILFICDEYPPGLIGGIGTSVQTLARQLVKQGHKVFVAGLYSYKYGEIDFDNDEGVSVSRLRYGLKLPVSQKSKLYSAIDKLPDVIKKHLNGKKAFNHFISFLRTLIDKENIDIIEIADYNNFCQHIGFVVEWPAFKVPLVLKSHGSHTHIYRELGLPTNKKLEQTDRLLFKRADALSSVSQYIANKNALLFNLKKDSRVLYNGIDVSEQKQEVKREDRTVIFTGSITAGKGIFSLMKAWNKVHEKLPDARLLVLGKGRIDKAEAILSESSRATVFFMGHVSKPILKDHLSKATLSVFPSYSESFGLGAVEAMSMSCPVIYTKLSCGPEIVSDNKTGLLVDPENIHEISESILCLLNDKSKRERLASEAFKTVIEKFDSKKIALQHISFYTEVITKSNKK